MKSARQSAAAAKRKKGGKAARFSITPETRMSTILEHVPDAAEIFAMHGLHCAGCQFQTSDTLEEGMGLHGKSERHMQELMDDLKHGLPEERRRPKSITLTKDAAIGLRDMLREQRKEEWMLAVIPDDAGGFCMEFLDEKTEEHLVFTHPEVPEVRVVATELTLASVGGSTVDLREGRFKLDLPSTSGGCACKEKH